MYTQAYIILCIYIYTGLEFLMKMMIMDRQGSDSPWVTFQIR